MDKETILVVDDEKEIGNFIEVYLKNEGYTILRAYSGEEALAVVNNYNVNLIILDVMMPGLDGIQTCIKLRESQDIPIIFLSAKSEDLDKIMGLSCGGDDYVTKPFNPLELVARVKSQLRKINRQKEDTKTQKDIKEIQIGDLTINSSTHEVIVDSKKIKLTPTEFSILELLAINAGIVFSAERIYGAVWKDDFFDSDNAVMVHIRKIREKLETDPRKPKYIKTIWGVGYKIEKDI